MEKLEILSFLAAVKWYRIVNCSNKKEIMFRISNAKTNIIEYIIQWIDQQKTIDIAIAALKKL